MGRTLIFLQPGIRVRDSRQANASLSAVSDVGVGVSRQLAHTHWHLGSEFLLLREISGFLDSQDNDLGIWVNARRTVEKGISFGVFLSVDARGPTDVSPSLGVHFSYADYEEDADGDGIKDRDSCPKAAEDLDGHLDADGCPDLDNDSDGILDKQDKCPQSAEDKDGFRDLMAVPTPTTTAMVYSTTRCLSKSTRPLDRWWLSRPGQRRRRGCRKRQMILKTATVSDTDGCPNPTMMEIASDTDDRCPLVRGILQWDGCRDVVVRIISQQLCPNPNRIVQAVRRYGAGLSTNPVILGVRVKDIRTTVVLEHEIVG